MKKTAFISMALFVSLACVAGLAAPVFAAPAREWPTWHNNGSTQSEPIVRAIQLLLRGRGYKLAADGVFGKATTNAVRAFQKKHEIVASGEVKSATWEALVVSLKSGSRGDAVRAAQVLLRHADYDVNVDGVFGSSTKNAVLKFQKANGRTRDGIVGLNTWCSLAEGSVGTFNGGD